MPRDVLFSRYTSPPFGVTQLITRPIYNNDKVLLREIKTRSAHQGLTVIERSRNTHTTNTARCA